MSEDEHVVAGFADAPYQSAHDVTIFGTGVCFQHVVERLIISQTTCWKTRVMCTVYALVHLHFHTCLHFYAMGPFKVPSVPVTRHTNSDLSTLPADATHTSSAENRTALTWLLCPLNLAHLAPFATHG